MKTLSPVCLRNTLCGLGLALATISSTGCQGVYNGQTLPSPWYLSDDIQYFPAGPRMKLWREAAAMKEFKEQEAFRAAGGVVEP